MENKETTNKTIAKNRTKLINRIFDQATHCESFTLHNYFNGTECSPEYAKKELLQFRFAKLKWKGGANFTVHVHSNCWFEIKSPALEVS